MDEPTGDGKFRPAVSVDVDALCKVAYCEGYEKGINDLLSRLRVLEIFTQEEHEGCLQLVVDTSHLLLAETIDGS